MDVLALDEGDLDKQIEFLKAKKEAIATAKVDKKEKITEVLETARANVAKADADSEAYESAKEAAEPVAVNEAEGEEPVAELDTTAGTSVNPYAKPKGRRGRKILAD
jgi:hypothetical protein